MAPGCPCQCLPRSVAAHRFPADLDRVGRTTGLLVLDSRSHARESGVGAHHYLVDDAVAAVLRAFPVSGGEAGSIQEAERSGFRNSRQGPIMDGTFVTWIVGGARGADTPAMGTVNRPPRMAGILCHCA